MSRLRGRIAVLVVALLLLAGCAGCSAATGRDGQRPGGPADGAGATKPTCVTPTPARPTASAAPTPVAEVVPPMLATAGPASARHPSAGGALPDITLPCFAGGQPVRLAHLGTPAVINLWASWCGPCRIELPQIQRYADRAAGRIQVVGVITNDPVRSRPQSLIDDLGLRFPMVNDESAALQHQLEAQVLPMTLLVDARGRVAYRYNARPLDEAALSGLVERYLGVRA
jgi:thiol-disulfide isomerase/thioredoxin